MRPPIYYDKRLMAGVVAIGIVTLIVILWNVFLNRMEAGNLNGIVGSLSVGIGLVVLLLMALYKIPSYDMGGNWGCLAILALGFGLWLLTFAPLNFFVCARDLVQGSAEKLDVQVKIEPAKLGKGNRTTLSISLHNNINQSITTEDMKLTLPDRFFDGFIVDYPTSPAFKAQSDGVLTFGGVQIASSQTVTLTVPLVANNAGNYTGEIWISTRIVKGCYLNPTFRTPIGSIMTTVLP